jgi:hypothetical protein
MTKPTARVDGSPAADSSGKITRDVALARPHVVPLIVTRPLATRSGCGPAAPCVPWRASRPCSPGPASAGPTRCINRS